jgi:hypothetical protein
MRIMKSSRLRLAGVFAMLASVTVTIASAEPSNGQLQTLQATCSANDVRAGLTNECLGPNATPDLRFVSAGPQFTYAVTFTAPVTHCSRIGYYVYTYDLSRNLGGTGLLGPGQSQTIEIGSGYAAGLQIAKVKAFGWISSQGCNTGTLQSWGAQATVFQR